MDVEERNGIARKVEVLRIELKDWEREFALTSGGRKPSREQIKASPVIGEKSALEFGLYTNRY
jgi:hypothetical protein